MYTLFKDSIKTRLDGSSNPGVTSLSILSLGMWESCSLSVFFFFPCEMGLYYLEM